MKKILPDRVEGALDAPSSKSMMIRVSAAALLANGKSVISRPSLCDDALAALQCIRALGASVVIGKEGVTIQSRGIGSARKSVKLSCGESGLCMRMFPPIAALLPGKTVLAAKGTLTSRNVAMMEKPLLQLGASCRSNGGLPPVAVQGIMKGGEVALDGSESSQFLTGLLMSLPLCQEDSVIDVSSLKSKPYAEMTLEAMRDFGVKAKANASLSRFEIPGKQEYLPRKYEVEGDWSGAAFLLVAGAIAGSVSVKGLRRDSLQADRAIFSALLKAGAKVQATEGRVFVAKGSLDAFELDATDCPDLFPPLAVLASQCRGKSKIRGASRLSGKESNRALSLVEELGKMGANISVKGDLMEITGGKLSGGAVDSHGDHRVAMACAVAALCSDKGAAISGAGCVSKSYPRFFDDLESLRVKK